MTRFHWTADASAGRFSLQGMVNSGAELTPLVTAAMARGALVLDVGGIRSFTSSGVQGWIEFLRALQQNGCQVVFERCSPAVVRQTGAIYDFLCGATVRSLLLPFICPRCDTEAEQELAVTAAAPPALPTTRRCTCGAEMELDDLPQLYTAFLADATPTPGC